MKQILSIITLIFCYTFSFAQDDITPDQLEPIEIEKIISSETTSYFGNSIDFSTDGSVLAIGEYGYTTPSSINSGRVQVYTNVSGSWSQKGQDILGTGDNFNSFGKKIELSSDGNTLAVYDSQIGVFLAPGQTLDDLFGSLAVEYFPYIQVYQYSSGVWTQIGNDFLFNDILDYSDMSLSGDGLSLAITTKAGTNVFEWNSSSWIATGQEIVSGDVLFDDKISLSEDGQTLIVGDPFYSDPNSVDQFSYEGRVKVYQNISNTWTQIGSTINGTDYLGYFGSHVSISNDGNTIAIGTAQTNNNDYIAILEFLNGNWTSKGTNISQGTTNLSSIELSDDGTAIIVGEDFTASVFKYDTDWEQQNLSIAGDSNTEEFGHAVSISGDGSLFAVGAPSIATSGVSGYVSIYVNNKNSVLSFGNEIYGYGDYDKLGSSVSVSADGNTIAMGANGSFNDNGTIRFGHVRVFEKTPNGLEQIGSDIRNTTDFDSGSFGSVVELSADGQYLAISAPLLFTSNWGAVYVYERVGNTWKPLGDIIYGTYGSRTGSSLSFSNDGSILAVGSGGNPGGVTEDSYTGYTTVYEFNNTTNNWDILGAQIPGEAASDFSGCDVDLSGDGTILAIGAYGNDGSTTSGGHGHARVFEFNGTDWIQMGADIDGDPAFNLNFGRFVTISDDGETLIVSDINSQSDAGSVKVYNWNQTTSQWDFQQLLKTYFGTGPNNSHRFEFGSTTAISDDKQVLAIGEYKAAGKGKAHVYVKNDVGDWVESNLFVEGTHNSNQYFGIRLDLSANGNTLAVGGWGHNENGTQTGMAGVYHLNLCSTIDGFEVFTGATPPVVTPSDNLIVNGSAEIVPVTNYGWTAVNGNWEWPISNNQGVPVQDGHKYFRSTIFSGVTAELYQDVDVSSFSGTIDANEQYFYFSTHLRSFASSGLDDSQAIVEYRDASGNVLSTYDTGLSQTTADWAFFENTRLAPAQTRTIRVRLIITNSGSFGAPNAFVDNVFLSTTVEPATVSIPDPNFELHLISQGIDSDGIINAQMQASDAIGETSLIMNNLNISDLTGIEAFTDLEILTAVDNNLTTIDISQNTALTSVILTLNSLTSIDVSNNTNLSTLNLTANNVSSLDLSNNTALSILDLSGNVLTSLDTSNLTNLTQFRANNNLLTALDLSSNINLIQVACASNDLMEFNMKNGFNNLINNTFFDATNNPNLTCIQVDDVTYSENTWTSVDSQTDFSTNCDATFINIPDPNFEQALISLNIDSDQIVNGQMLESDALGVTDLDVSSQNISDLTGIEFFTDLQILSAFDNNLSSIDITQNTQLTSAVLALNNLSSIDLSSNPSLVSISLNDNNLTTLNLTGNPNLVQVFVNNNNLNSIDVSVLPILENLGVAGNNLMFLDTGQNQSLNTLFCSDNQLESLSVKNGNNINLTNFETQNNPNLTCIEVDDVSYSNTNWLNAQPQFNFDTQMFFSLNCSTLINIPDPNFEQALVDAFIDSDQMVNGTISEADALNTVSLNVNSKNISDLTGIEFFTNLDTLFALDNNLSTVDLSANAALEILVLSLNNLTQIDLTNNLNLSSLSLASNQLTALDVSNNSGLTQLYVGSNNLSVLDVSSLTLLAELEVSLNQVVELDLSQNPALNQIYVNDNNLVNLNVKNGNNSTITNNFFNATNNSNLFCIEVDDENYSTSTWTNLDAQSSFGEDCAPSNDDCSDAQSITLGQDVPSTTQSSTSSGNVPGCQEAGLILVDVWFQFVAPASGSVTLTLDAAPVTLKSALYENCTDLMPIACGENGLQVDNLTPGQTYYIQTWVEADLSGLLPQSNLTEVGDFTIKVDDTSTLSTFAFNDFEASFKMFPNPAQTYVTLDANQPINGFEIYSINGQKVLSQSNLNSQNHSVDVSMLSKGIYLIKVSSENSTLTQKLIIR